MKSYPIITFLLGLVRLQRVLSVPLIDGTEQLGSRTTSADAASVSVTLDGLTYVNKVRLL